MNEYAKIRNKRLQHSLEIEEIFPSLFTAVTLYKYIVFSCTLSEGPNVASSLSPADDIIG